MENDSPWERPERRVQKTKHIGSNFTQMSAFDPERQVDSPPNDSQPCIYPTDPERTVYEQSHRLNILEAENRVKKILENGSTALNLSGLGLKKLPSNIFLCRNLNTLVLSDNDFKEIHGIQDFERLQALDLSNNKLSSLPRGVVDLCQLKSLRLDGNFLDELPSRIGRCAELTELYLRRNHLLKLPVELRRLSKLKYILLHDNSSLGLPPEILSLLAPKLLDYYFNVIVGGGRPLNEVKLLLIGRGGAGKTAILNRLLGNEFVPETEETLGIEIKDWQLNSPDGDPVTVHSWDFAGQTITHGLHAYFFSHRSLYLLILSGREETAQEDAEYWLKIMEAYAMDPEKKELPPVIVVLNKWESGESRAWVDREALQEKYSFIAGWVEVDCKTGLGFKTGEKRLPDLMRQLVASMDWVRVLFPAAWHKAKEHFSRMEQEYVSYAGFRKICSLDLGIKEDEVASLAGVLHRLGVALNYGDDQRLKDTTVLNPHWLTRTLYKVLRQVPAAVIDLDHVASVLPNEPYSMRLYVVELMRRFEQAFPLVEREGCWLIPARLPEVQPAGVAQEFGPEVSDCTRLKFAVNPLPKTILPRFITRTHYLSDDLPHMRWANGVVLELNGARALVRADFADRIITITLTGVQAQRPVLSNLCRRELARLFAEIPGLNPHELMEVRPGIWAGVVLMEELEKSNEDRLPVEGGGKIQIVTVKSELDAIAPEDARDFEIWKPSIFVSYSHTEERFKDEFETRLRLLQAAGKAGQVWTDRMLEAGDDWESGIIKNLTTADIVVILLSNAALASRYIQTVELKKALERHAVGKAEVIPVILERCQWRVVSELSSLKALPKDGKPIREWKPRNVGWHDVMEAVTSKIESMMQRRREDQIGA